MVCGNGTDTGLGVNPGDAPDKLVILVQGGGACWDALTCFVLEGASHISTGWGAAQLQSEVEPLGTLPWFDRDAPDNPWADATFALVPYCTGDLHAGSSVQAYNPLEPHRRVHHAGDGNLQAALAALAQGIPETSSVWAIGLSAGGYGVQLHADRFVDTFASADVALLADGSPMVEPVSGRWSTWGNAWSMRLPEDCPDCATSARATLQARLDQVPDTRMGLVTSREDAVISLYFGTNVLSVDELVSDVYVPAPHHHAFVIDGADHVLLSDPSRETPSGIRLQDWIDDWRDDGPTWTDAL